YTVMYYYIDDVIITNPLEHKGNEIKLDILATFLPQMVVDSLYAVISKLNLEIKYMTLEPIASIEVAIPENARLLNLALVDIGAGTSDIAITRDGTIVAYGMTASAGDDITEQIAKEYLLDFDAAEKLKINLNREKVQRFSDIVGIPYELESKQILGRVEPTIRKIANLIANNIIEQNGKPPSAVFLIGGGSQMPLLDTFIAEELNLPKERVAVRGIEVFEDMFSAPTSISGPEYITPIGILAKALRNRELDFIEIYVNEQRFRLFQTKRLQVKDALVLAGFNPRKLIPGRGKSINININGSKKTLHGEYGEAAKIVVNDDISSMESNIKDGDVIKVYPAERGRTKIYSLKDILPLENRIFVNDDPILQIYNYAVNNKIASEDTIIENGDYIKYDCINDVKDLCVYMGIDYEEYIIEINNEVVMLDRNIKDNDHINIKKKENESNLLKNMSNFDDRGMKPENKKIMVKCNDMLVKIPDKKDGVIFVDIFDYIDFDRSKVHGKLILQLNGKNANYTDSLKTGDEVKVYWDN
ncbi:MAG TPA: cell division FtsA domain-containing protein, partial [Oscillospiraceae bacterium]|nr:cell division FtsA domain-containing protein [Oscillospiraceae bacterium]